MAQGTASSGGQARVEAVRSELAGLEAAERSATGGQATHVGVKWSVAALRVAIRAVRRDLAILEPRAAVAS